MSYLGFSRETVTLSCWVKWSLDIYCPMKEIQKIVGYPKLVMFMLMHHNLVDQLQVAMNYEQVILGVWCLLFVHCALAKFPGYLWVYLEGKRLEKLLDKGATINNLAKFLTDHPNWYTRYEATSFFICQVLALISSRFS